MPSPTPAPNRHPASKASQNGSLAPVFEHVQRKSGVNLHFYKAPTIRRRIERRMSLLKLPTVERYVEYLKKHDDEAEVLAHDVLIKVTEFFRDPPVFGLLCRKVLQPLARRGRRAAADPIRIWVPGCCSGEEPYSIAIALLECLEKEGARVPVRIFGTDVGERVLERARAGVYPARIAHQVSPQRLSRFFHRTRDGYQVDKRVREICTFARQDLTQDPPFSKMDLISCRNVLIYLNPDLQNRAFALFHYALKPDGHLLLGKSESIGTFFPDLFAPADKSHALYRKKSIAVRPDMGQMKSQPAESKKPPAAAPSAARADLPMHREIDRLMSHHAPPALLLTDSFEILETRGDLSRFLKITPGKTSFSVSKMVREELALELRMALTAARRTGKPACKSGIPIQDGRRRGFVDLEALPLVSPLLKERYFLVFFKDVPPSAAAPRAGNGPSSEKRLIADLRGEIASLKAYVQSIGQEHEATSQELRSANEEILSSNEELQSTNEELETAKEELESTNEEISTVNEELEKRNEELRKTLEKYQKSKRQLSESEQRFELLVRSVQDYAIFLLDAEGRVATWNAGAERIKRYRAEEIVGQHFSKFYLPEDAEKPPRLLEIAAREGRCEDEGWRVRKDGTRFWANVVITALRGEDGHVVGFAKVTRDMTERRRAEEAIRKAHDDLERKVIERTAELRESEERKTAVLNAALDCIITMDAGGNVVEWNPAAERTFGWTAAEAVGKNMASLIIPPDFRQRHGEGLARYLRTSQSTIMNRRLEMAAMHRDGRLFPVELTVTSLRVGGKTLFTGFIRDISSRLEAENQLRQSNEALLASNKELEQFAYVASHDLQEPLRKIIAFSDRLKERRIEGMGETERDYFERMQSAALRTRTLIDDLLNFSRVTTRDAAFERVDLGEAVREVLGDLEARIAQTKAAVHAEPLPVVSANPLQMRQLFTNLVGNSLKFAKNGQPPRVEIRYRPQEHWHEIDVVDNGIGFDEKYLDRIFKPFQRLHGRDAYEGTGIGLAICQKIVQKHGGELTARSRPDEGSTFTIRLPRPG